MKLEYMHQIIPDTGINKPFERREVEVTGTHEKPECLNFADHCVCECVSGPFVGHAGTGDTWEDAWNDLVYMLMDASRKAFVIPA